MNILYALTKEHSKELTTTIVNWVGDDQQRFDKLFNLLFNQEYKIIQRAAWPISYCAIKHPHLIKKHYFKMLGMLNMPNLPNAVKRNILRILDQIDEIPKTYHGMIMDACFKYIEDPKENIAPQAFALGILQKLSVIYPEIKPELRIIVEARMPNSSAAFRSRAKKILAEIP